MIWDLVAASSSQGMSILHVCVDFIYFPCIKLTHRGFSSGFISLTGLTGRTKCPIALASPMDISTAILILEVLNTVWSWRLIFEIVCFHVCALVGKMTLLGSILIFSSSLLMEESSYISAVGAILSL